MTTVSVVGGANWLRVNQSQASLHSAVNLEPGHLVEIGPPNLGARTYVAFGQGKSRILAEGPDSLNRTHIRYLPGPEGSESLHGQEFTVSRSSNRVGLRLEGPRLEQQPDRPSHPVARGTIQLTNEGLPIILGPDGPTIGGYPRIGVVIGADLDKTGQLMPGDRFFFKEVTLLEAQKAMSEYQRRLAHLKQILRIG